MYHSTFLMKYLSVIILHTKKILVDRARFFIWILVDTLGVIVLPFVWLAILGDRDMLLGFTRADIVTYFILVYVINLVATSHISEYVHADIMKGDLNKLLVRPIVPPLYHAMAQYGYKFVSLFVACAVCAIAITFFPEYISLPPTATHAFWFLFFLVFAGFHSSAIQIIVGLATFWLGETAALMQLRHVLEKIFSGEFGPLSLFPILIQAVGAWLPFQYLFFVPIQIYLGKLSGGEILSALFGMLFWSMMYLFIIIFLWRRGMRRYEGVGI